MFRAFLNQSCLLIALFASFLIFGSTTSHAQAVACAGSYDPTTPSVIYFDPSNGSNGTCSIKNRAISSDGVPTIEFIAASNGGKVYSMEIAGNSGRLLAFEHSGDSSISISSTFDCNFGSVDDLCDASIAPNTTTNATIEFPANTGNVKIEAMLTHSNDGIQISSARAYIVNDSAPTPLAVSNFVKTTIGQQLSAVAGTTDEFTVPIVFSQPVTGFSFEGSTHPSTKTAISLPGSQGTSVPATTSNANGASSLNPEADVIVTNALLLKLEAIGSTGKYYRAYIRWNKTNDMTISVPANIAQNAAGDGNLAAHSATFSGISETPGNGGETLYSNNSGGGGGQKSTMIIVADTTPPTVEIQSSLASHDTVTPFDITISFSENVNGFTASGIIATNATVSNLSGVDKTYTATITPTMGADITLNIPAGSVQDSAGNQNLAAPQVTIRSNITEKTSQIITSSLSNRAQHILNNQPDLSGFADRSNLAGAGPLGTLAINGNENVVTLAFATSRSKILAAQAQARVEQAFDVSKKPNENKSDGLQNNTTYGLATPNGAAANNNRTGTWDIWTRIYGSRTHTENSDSSLWVGYVGVHYFTSPNVLIGFMGQLDWSDEKSDATRSKTKGTGWMVGPYIAGRVSQQSIKYEARLAWGQSTNKISPIATYEDTFDTTRWLANAKITGTYDWREYQISPSASISWFEEEQHSYMDGLNNLIPKNSISLGVIRFGPSLSRSFLLKNGGRARPHIGISGIKNFGIESSSNSTGTVIGNDDFRARLDFGINIIGHSKISLSANGFYDGIGIDDYDSYGGSLKLTVPLN